MKPDYPNTPETNLPPMEYANGEPERQQGGMDIGPPRPAVISTQIKIENLPQTLSVAELAERSRNGGL